MASRKSAMLSKIVRRNLSASAQPGLGKTLKPFSDIPGLSTPALLFGMFKADFKKGLENNAVLWDTFGDMVRIEIPIKPPKTILILFDPEHCEKVYRATGAQPIRPGFDALRYAFSNKVCL